MKSPKILDFQETYKGSITLHLSVVVCGYVRVYSHYIYIYLFIWSHCYKSMKQFQVQPLTATGVSLAGKLSGLGVWIAFYLKLRNLIQRPIMAENVPTFSRFQQKQFLQSSLHSHYILRTLEMKWFVLMFNLANLTRNLSRARTNNFTSLYFLYCLICWLVHSMH